MRKEKRIKKEWGLMTKLIHADNEFNPTASNAMPIVQTSTYKFQDVEEGEAAFSPDGGMVDAYTRLSGPNFRTHEEQLCALEKGEIAQVLSSGMASINTVISAFTSAGDAIIAHKGLYGGTFGSLTEIWPKFGVKVYFTDFSKREIWRKELWRVFNDPHLYVYGLPKIVFLETPSNPSLDICDIKAISSFVKKYSPNTLIVVDNTFATAYNQRPLELGADIVVISETKYNNGFGTTILGAIVCSKKEYMDALNSNVVYFGPTADPFAVWLVSYNIQTLPLRMPVHNKNGLAVAQFLESHPKVEKVYYPGLKSHPGHSVAKKQMIGLGGEPGYGGMLSFEIMGPQSKTRDFLNKIARDKKNGEGVITLGVSLGIAKTMIECAALMTHALVPEEKRLEQGITEKSIRLSVGLEDIEDIIDSLESALAIV